MNTNEVIFDLRIHEDAILGEMRASEGIVE